MGPWPVMLIAILHVIGDDDPYGIVATLMDAVPPGSYLAISQVALQRPLTAGRRGSCGPGRGHGYQAGFGAAGKQGMARQHPDRVAEWPGPI